MSRLKICLRYLSLGLLALVSTACGGGESQEGQKRGPVSIKVKEVTVKNVPRYIKGIGSARSNYAISIYPQVDGEIVETFVNDGDMVKKGQLLFKIDPRPYEATLKEEEASVEQYRAEVLYQESLVDRYQKLIKDQIVSEDTFAQAKSALEEQKALLREAEAARDNAQIDLEYCYIHAPVDGVLGIINIDQGNVVQTTDVLASLRTLKPIDVVFTIPQQYVAEVRQYIANSKKGYLDVVVTTLKGKEVTGRLLTLQNEIDTLSGTLELEAEVPNTHEELWPGEYVNVALNLTELPNAILIPQDSLQINSSGNFVYVVGHDKTVEMRPVKLGQRFGSDLVIEKGLQEGDVVVTEGQLKLSPGAKVTY